MVPGCSCSAGRRLDPWNARDVLRELVNVPVVGDNQVRLKGGSGCSSPCAADGTDLDGTIVRRGTDPDGNGVRVSDGWYSGYLRAATNEKAVLRFYLSAGSARLVARLEASVREALDRLQAKEIE